MGRDYSLTPTRSNQSVSIDKAVQRFPSSHAMERKDLVANDVVDPRHVFLYVSEEE